ncbi:MAG: DUF1501 domain-containing protein [Planctomycetaceae bacterium]
MHSRLNRRTFLKSTSLIALGATAPALLRQTAHAIEGRGNERILVVIQLSGGNDGINTVVPFNDEGYAKHRPKLKLNADRLIKVSDDVALHPSMKAAAELLDDGRFAVVQGVGYPNPNRSHDVSMAIWQTARFDPEEHKTFGWIGRAADERPAPADGSPHAMLIGTESPPIALRGRRSTTAALAHLGDLRLSAGAAIATVPTGGTRDELLSFASQTTADSRATAQLLEHLNAQGGDASGYPESELSKRLRSVSQLIKAGFSTPVYYAIQSGYDTHAAQSATHSRLLRELSAAMRAFLQDLQAARLSERVLVLCFSEFGRRVSENASLGTDHGTAGPVFVAGEAIHAGLFGETPNLSDLDGDDLKMQFDFRQVYATILDDWLGVASTSILGGTFEPLKLTSSCSRETAVPRPA